MEENANKNEENPYQSYACKKGHCLNWGKTSYVMSKKKCAKCKKNVNDNVVLRWNCSTCNELYCQNCRKIVVSSKCPLGDKYTYQTDFTSVLCLCDVCGKKQSSQCDIWACLECDISICLKCGGEYLNE